MSDQITIHTNGLEEAIRCAICENPIKSERGCDGSCKYDKELHAKIVEAVTGLADKEKTVQGSQKPEMVCPFRTETIKTESGTREIYPKCETIRCPFYNQESTYYGLFCPAECGRAEKEKG